MYGRYNIWSVVIIKKYDKILFYSILILSIFGILMIYSSSYIWAEYKFNDPIKYFKNQTIFFLIGIAIMNIVSKIDYKKYKNKANIVFSVCFFLLILVLIPGIGSVRNGSRSWFGIGGFGIQPSEFMKIALIIFTAKYLEKIKHINFKTVLPIFLVTLITFGVIMLQPDFGTGVIILMTTIGLLFISGLNMSFFIKGGIIGIIGVIILILIAPYRMDRITSFINPWKDPLGTGFQIIQSLYSIGPGGLLGQGFGGSIQKHFYLPEPQTDFIFSIISEEFGFLGIIIVTILFVTIIWRGIKISINSKDLFSKYLSFGIIFSLSFQTILNLMVVVGLIPVTGVTLPFLSYGGSSLLVSMAGMGILLNIGRN